jgi:hypothetical protein
MALARLGEADAMAAIVCQLQTGEPRIRFDAVGKLRYAGGGMAISALIKALGNTENNVSIVQAHQMVGNIRQEIEAALNDLVNRSKLIPSGSTPPRDRHEWELWQKGNRAKLISLEPVPLATAPTCAGS